MKFVLIPALALAAAAPAAAQTPIALPAFDSVELRGGGAVTIRHGAEQRVTLVSGTTDLTEFVVDDEGRLEIRACIRRCSNYDLEVEIVTPDLDALAIRGGGSIRADGAFPDNDELAVAVTGGGSIDVRPIEAGEVAASVHGGGSIRAHARDSLAASILGGGSITYWGDPSVARSIAGGGTIRRGSR